MKTLITILLASIISSSCLAAQKLPTKDTIYYLVDTIKIPVKDQMLEIGIDGPFKYYSIQCRCLKYNQMPTFIYNINRSKSNDLIKSDKIKTINFTSLSKLISLSQQDGGDSFNNYHVTFFIEHIGNNYIKHLVRLLKPQKREPTIDYEIIKNDSISKKPFKN
jgi:hypothetical protein